MADWTEKEFRKNRQKIKSPTRNKKATVTKLGTFGAASECRSVSVEEATEWMKKNIAELQKKARIRRSRA
jgi:hypothetical protein